MSKFKVTHNDGSTSTIEADGMEIQTGSGSTILTKGDKIVASFAGGSFINIMPADATSTPAPVTLQDAVNAASGDATTTKR